MNTGMLKTARQPPYNVVLIRYLPAPISRLICAGNNRLFRRLCHVLKKPEWAEDERYRTNALRLKNQEELIAGISAIVRTKPADEWLALLSEHQIPAAKVNNIAQAFEHPQVKARELVETLHHPKIGGIKMMKSPLRFSGLNVASKYPPPLLGEHTEEVLLEELGMSPGELRELRERRVI